MKFKTTLLLLIIIVFSVDIWLVYNTYFKKTTPQAIKIEIPETSSYIVPEVVKTPVNINQITFSDLLKTNVVKKIESVAKLIKKTTPQTIKIAILGDSMVDTMGEGLPYLRTELQNSFPDIQFELLNYGVSSTNMEYGLERMTTDFSYQDRDYKSIISYSPDILILGSFAYNPFNQPLEEGLDYQWSIFNQINTLTKGKNIKLIVLVTIAPNKQYFGQGLGGITWPYKQAFEHAQKIELYLQNAIKYTSSSKLPLVNVYEKSLDINQDGNLDYISSHDHIHPNQYGHQLIAQLINQKLVLLNWF